MDAEMKAKWLEALRSGKYQQVRGKLRTSEGHCCLGVLCDIVDPNGWNDVDVFEWKGAMHSGLLPYTVNNEFDINPDKEKLLSDKNDDGASFTEIADWIEENL